MAALIFAVMSVEVIHDVLWPHTYNISHIVRCTPHQLIRHSPKDPFALDVTYLNPETFFTIADFHIIIYCRHRQLCRMGYLPTVCVLVQHDCRYYARRLLWPWQIYSSLDWNEFLYQGTFVVVVGSWASNTLILPVASLWSSQKAAWLVGGRFSKAWEEAGHVRCSSPTAASGSMELDDIGGFTSSVDKKQ